MPRRNDDDEVEFIFFAHCFVARQSDDGVLVAATYAVSCLAGLFVEE